MPLLALYERDRETVSQFTIEQVVSFAGDGELRDNSECSVELRRYVSQVSSEKLIEYVEGCLNKSFKNSGYVLQDLVNELGRRLDFDVIFGRYAGKRGEIGNDGLWSSNDQGSLIVEVKTTDTYRISLDTIARYRDALLENGGISENCSILVVVGRQDTGELEAQIRGSRHAWDVRLVSSESLLKLVKIKENSDEPETGKKIRGLLKPIEYTRIDGLVDVVFTAASDMENVDQIIAHNDVESRAESHTKYRADISDIHDKRSEVIEAAEARISEKLIRRTRAAYWSADRTTRVVCTISKRYDKSAPYWYAYHPSWREFLAEARDGYFILACLDREEGFFLPFDFMESVLDRLNTTKREKDEYWHIKLSETGGKIELVIPNGQYIDLTEYRLPL